MLNGIRIIEFSADAAGAMAGRLLAAYGADVVVVEPPEGHPTRFFGPRAGDEPDSSILFAYLGSGKRSVVLDLDDAASRAAAAEMIAGADVVIDSYAPGVLAAKGLDLARLVEALPALVVCSITPFGQDGPRAGWRATALTASAAGGQMAICGDADEPPLKTAGHQAHYQGGLHGFAAIASALCAAARSGVGDWIDISMQEVQASTLEGVGPGALNLGSEAGRTAGNQPFAQWGIHACKDGFIGLAAMPRQSFAVYDCIGHPELKDNPEFASGWAVAANEVLSVLIPEWTSERTAEEIFEYASSFRAPFAMIPGPRELLEWPGLRDVGFWKEVEHPVLGRHPLPSGPIEFGGGWRGQARKAPLLGEHTAEVLSEPPRSPMTTAVHVDPPRALAGIRVVDVTQVWAGPYGTRFLGDLGAEVIKVEGPSFADPVRTMTGARAVPEINQSAYFNEYNRNKLGISLDIKQPEGMQALKRLIAAADVFIENWSSGVADRLGLGYADLKALNPRLVYVSMPGFGHEGRDADRIGFGPTIEQMGGLVALQGYEGGPPHRSGISYGDPVSGTISAAAVALMLYQREQTGEGCYAVVPQRDAICSLVAEYVIAESLGCPVPLRIGSRDIEWAPHNVYRCADTPPRFARVAEGRPLVEFTDAWLAIAVDNDRAWEGLKRVVADPELEDAAFSTMAGRHAAQERLDEVINRWTAAREPAAAAAELQAAGIAAAPVLTPLLIAGDEHLLARNFFLTYTHPATGEIRGAAPAWRWRRRPFAPLQPAPEFGQHSREVLHRVAGYSDAEIDRFIGKLIVTSDLIPSIAG